MVEQNIEFTVKKASTLKDLLSPAIYLRESTLPDEVAFDTMELASFFTRIRSKRTPHMKLSCGSYVPLKRAKYLQNPYIAYPESPQRFTLQFHVRGLSVHGDLRMTVSKSQAIGWTLDAGKSLTRVLLRRTPAKFREEAGITEAHIKNLPLKDLSKKLDTTKGRKLKKALTKKVQELPFSEIKKMVEELWKDEIEPILADPNKKILTQRKAPMSPVWLDYEQEVPPGAVGATRELEGQLIILDKGAVEFGAQKAFFHEYFIKGDKIGKRRMVVRRIPTRQSWGVKESFAWLTFFTKDEDLPYTISRRAVTQDWMPPQGVSALPQDVQSQIPRNQQYWRAKNAKSIRNRLVDEIKAKRVPIKLEAGLQFSIKRVWHRDPEVRRGLPVTRYWLILHDGSKIHDAFDFGRDSNPLEGMATARRRSDEDLKELIPVTGELSPEHSASRVSKIATKFDTSDQGKIRILEDSNNRIMVSFDGQKLKGTHALIRESPSGETWIFQQVELPKEKRAMLLADTSAVLHCGTNDINFKRKGNLLILNGPAIKPGEVIPMDGEPTFFTYEGIKNLWPSMYRQPIVILHGELKGDVVGFVDSIHFDDKTGWGWVDDAVIWHPGAIELVLNKTLASFSIEVIPETIWCAEHNHSHVIGGRSVGLSIVPKGACPTCNPISARMGKISDLDGKVYKFGMNIPEYLEHNYWTAKYTTTELGELMGVPRSTVESWMNRFGIPRRDLKEARRLRAFKEEQIKASGGRASIFALGTGTGQDRRNHVATLFSIGTQHLLVNAPRGIIDMVGIRQAKPTFILIERPDESALGGLHELRGLKANVFAIKPVWDFLRKHYRVLSGQKGKFEDIYDFKRYVLQPEKSLQMGAFEVNSFEVAQNTLGFKINLSGKQIWHGSSVLSIPEQALQDVDVFIGDGSSLKKGVDPEHASMEEQIKWAQEADIPKIYFTQISEDHVKLSDELQELAPNSQALYDGAEITLGGSNPLAVLPQRLLKGLLSNEINVLLRSKPYSEYAKQAILMGTEELAYALYVEGFPKKMSIEEAVKLKHGISDEAWEIETKELDSVWVYYPRILKRFEPPRTVRVTETLAGPYLHDAELIEG